jgi:hypothetical protein
MRHLRRWTWLGWTLAVVALAPEAASADNVAEFIGRSDQNGNVITHYGYVTHVRGVNDANLFFDPANRSEATAKVTYFATTTLNARHVVGNIITTATAPGTLTFFLRASGGATFTTPSSFAVGIPISTFTVRYHNVLIVLGANSEGQPVGIASATADVEGEPPVGPALRLRVAAAGQGTLVVNDAANPVSVFLIGGSFVEAP